jgi:hypothetical protein
MGRAASNLGVDQRVDHAASITHPQFAVMDVGTHRQERGTENDLTNTCKWRPSSLHTI